MKKFSTLLLACFLSASTFAQDDIETVDNAPGVSSSSPFSSSARAPYCSKCYKRHYHGCVPTTPTPPASVPIDGGVSVLLAAGAAYGLKRMRAKKVQA